LPAIGSRCGGIPDAVANGLSGVLVERIDRWSYHARSWRWPTTANGGGGWAMPDGSGYSKNHLEARGPALVGLAARARCAFQPVIKMDRATPTVLFAEHSRDWIGGGQVSFVATGATPAGSRIPAGNCLPWFRLFVYTFVPKRSRGGAARISVPRRCKLE